MKDWKPTAANKVLHLRARLNALIRKFFSERGVLEVETPVLHTSAGGGDCPRPALVWFCQMASGDVLTVAGTR